MVGQKTYFLRGGQRRITSLTSPDWGGGAGVQCWISRHGREAVRSGRGEAGGGNYRETIDVRTESIERGSVETAGRRGSGGEESFAGRVQEGGG